ncbi:hypothetical protein C1752_08484 [Acaryochloris thomasi RCC1774]|uniref:Uncharacterized protein n=1 Tax=Acaryochloris thomasi RCC1774 TaxID=1764569 RepID=A0A2W1JJ16_9CYAN|nr:hypothetical protein [Acaryochloris thomasi]PZD71042.1 hypothetical protein C1752_08484 [Acaryochloris thomasi RCC1774]
MNIKASDEFLASMKHFGSTTQEQIELNQLLLDRIKARQEKELTPGQLQERREEYALFEENRSRNRQEI